ncbi:MAG: hypothetical protein L6R36_004645 [Xanthoria steineri]|nr:MAG: hypothetical protein L6R36_004645 [Xanthoria steineri]
MLAKYCLSSLALPALCCNAVAVSAGKPDCEEVQFTYNITSTIANVPPPPDLSTNEAIISYLPVLVQNLKTAPNVTREGRYTLAGLFCKAPNHKKQSFPLQVLAHGSSYTKEYWNRAAWGNMTVENSWQQFAYEKGYSTLAIDRLCYGASSHPDPLLDCQLTTSIETFHTLFGALRNGTASPRIPIPTELAFVGHSAGSITVSNFVEAYPNDVDTAILTDWPSGPIANIGAAEYYSSHNLTPPATPPSQPAYAPGALAFPARFRGLAQGYIASRNASQRQIGYSGRYDHSYPFLDYLTQSTFPLGEATYTGVLSFSAFRGKVIVATGDLDSFAHADLDVIARTRGRFPSASSFDWVNGTQSGHLVNYHRSAHQTYGKVFALLGNRRSATQ